MAKKKGKKNTQKHADVTSAPASPKPTPAPAVEESATEVTEPLELTPEAPAVDTIPDEQPESTTEAPEAKIDEAVDGPTPEPTTQDATEPEAPSSEEQELAESSSPKDEAATEPIVESATEAEATPAEEVADDASIAQEVEEAVTEATPESIEPVEEDVNDVAEPEAVPAPVAEGETEAVNAPVEESPASAVEVPAEAEKNTEHKDAAAPEVTHDAVNGHSDDAEAATIESASVVEEPQEESQAVEPVAEVPVETAAPVPTEPAIAEAKYPPAEDDWASLPKKGKKNKKDKKRQAAAEPVSEVAGATPIQEVPVEDSVAKQPVEEPTAVEPTEAPQESVPEAPEADPLPISEGKAVPEPAVEPESIAQEPVVEPTAVVEPAVVETARAPAPRPEPEPEPEPPAAPAAAADPGLSNAEHDTSDIFSRISQAIPDLHASLARQKEVHGQLSQKLRAKDEEIYELKERIIHIENKHSAEAKEQVKELREQIAETHKHKREAEDTKLAWEASTRTWETKVKELEAMYASEKAQAKKEFDEWKAAASTRHDAEKIALAIQYDKKLKEADLLAEARRQEEVDALVAEKEELREEHERQQQEREEIFTTEREELETKLSDAQKEHEEARENWLAEREALIRSHQEHSDSLQSGWSEEREALDAKYQEAREESDRAWTELHSEANRRAEELAREKDDLLRKYDELKAESQKEKEIIKSVAANLESEKSRLEKMMECYGDIAEIKSKGDTYYLVSFSQLQKQIIDLAATHFKHLPVRPPHEELAQVPHNLPSFLGDTPASRQVRAAYIAHTVSKLITYRVFGPFLFSLGRRYDKADSLFLSMSHHIRDKSTRKEAIWRQQTLLAAFTSSGAKQRINTAAGTVVEEIVNAIKHFADPREEEGIKIAVKRIVKLAAETWRFARLEREMITATMPALYDEEHQFTGPDFWPACDNTHKPDGTLIGSLADTTHPSDGQPTLLLRLFPVIYREPKHENFHANGERNDEGCIYHHGMALYDDAEPVITRAEELKSAGLPSFTTASPTNAEFGKFPPPMVPPPRNPLPPTPAMSEKTTSVRTKSPPPSPHEGSDRSPRRRRTPPPPPSSIAALNEAATLPVRAYQRPPPGPIDFATPRNIIGMPPPVESIFTQAPSKASKTPPESVFTETGRLLAEHASIPEAVEEDELPEPTPADSETLPVFLEHEPPTPPHSPHSRSSTPERPASPLFEAIDEIESLQSHRIQPSLRRRRSTRTRNTEDELPDITPRPDTLRRTSGYALSNRTLRSERSERTERSGKSERTERTEKPDLKTRYMCESRSAGVKALYPNSPMSMQNGKAFKEAMQAKRASKDSMRSDSHQKWLKEQRKQSPEKQGRPERSERSEKPERSERSERSERPERSDRGSRELRREKSMKSVAETIPDNGTWDTNSTLSSLETNTQFSVNEH
ncbi:hypothetical protein N0V87_000450 [Didymella glomerata]|uniref:Uncharacterized protein n=1 Tax=Didymella glomerata TaxID=749621 RepID=A0A9W8X8X6_9PLEO|nr:hypothetical protein N0V87_000450 [Didymella glomerata]